MAIIVGVVFCSYILGSLAAMLTTTAATAYKSILTDADSVCRETRLPRRLRRRINAYYRARVAFTTPFDWRALISKVPYTLHKDVVVYLHADSPVPAALTGRVWLPGEQAVFDRQLLYDIALASQPRWAEKGEGIVFKDDLIDEVIVLETSVPKGSVTAPGGMTGDTGPQRRPSARSIINPSEMLRQLAPSLASPSSSPDAATRPYEVLGLPIPEEGARWSEHFIVQNLCFYWTIPMAVLRELSARYPDVAAAVLVEHPATPAIPAQQMRESPWLPRESESGPATPATPAQQMRESPWLPRESESGPATPAQQRRESPWLPRESESGPQPDGSSRDHGGGAARCTPAAERGRMRGLGTAGTQVFEGKPVVLVREGGQRSAGPVSLIMDAASNPNKSPYWAV